MAQNETNEHSDSEAHEDAIQMFLTNYAADFSFETLSDEAVKATRARVVDTLGALLAGFESEPAEIAREIAQSVTQHDGATIIGTQHRTTPDLAAFANATASRFAELNDAYHHPGSSHGHPSDVVMPVLAASESVHATGKEFLAAVALAYEVYLRFADVAYLDGSVLPPFDNSVFAGFGVAVAAANVFKLSPSQIKQAISLAVVPNNALNQTRTGELTMWKAGAAGQAGRSAVFAAMLARLGMEGAHLPFEGEKGWLDHVARNRFKLEPFGGNGRSFKVEETLIKLRPCCGMATSSILAAEVAHKQLGNPEEIERVTVEGDKRATELFGTGAHHWNPTSRFTADHSIPYVVAATLHDGTITLRQYDEAHLTSPKIRETLSRLEVLENPEFTKDSEQVPVIHRTRVTIVKKNGDVIVGESGGSSGDISVPKSDDFIGEKFSGLAKEYLSPDQIKSALDQLWSLEKIADVATLPALLAFS